MEGIDDANYKHMKRVWEDFRTSDLGEYHDLHVQSDTLLRAAVFKKIRKKCIEIYEFGSSYFLTTAGSAKQACLKKTEYF